MQVLRRLAQLDSVANMLTELSTLLFFQTDNTDKTPTVTMSADWFDTVTRLINKFLPDRISNLTVTSKGQ